MTPSGRVVDTAFGPVAVLWNGAGRLVAVRLMPSEPICSDHSLPVAFSSLADDVIRYFAGDPVDFRPYLSLCDMAAFTAFRARVYAHVATIPYGRSERYAEVAAAIGSPNAVRAVGGAMAANPLPLIVPCHRVVAAAGLGGFSAGCGIDLKRRMLELEGVGCGPRHLA